MAVFDYIKFPSFTPTTGMTHFLVLNYNFSKEKGMLSEDDRVLETCRSVLNVLM